MGSFQHQSPADLAAAIQGALANFDMGLRATAVDHFDSASISALESFLPGMRSVVISNHTSVSCLR